jgi:hypothetical protein
MFNYNNYHFNTTKLINFMEIITDFEEMPPFILWKTKLRNLK